MEKNAYIAIGSNQGDRELYLLRAVAEIGKLSNSRVTGLSPFYETTPVGVTDQPDFYNAVLRLTTSLSPHDLLKALQNIEESVFKRKRDRRWGPRNIDLDILLYADEVIDTEELQVPHPRMAERLFVLKPLNDIAPEAVHPQSGLSVAEMLKKLKTDEKVTLV